MASGVQFSKNWEAVRSRIRRLPQFAEGVADSQRKRDAENLISYWRSGLRENSLHLVPLKAETVARKIRRGYAMPASPLYGLGLEGTRTYIKGMRKFRTGKGYRVQMVNARHHESKLSLKSLFIVHEYGTTIRRGDKIIRIPARPAMQAAYTKVMAEIKSNDPSVELRRAAGEYVAKGHSATAEAVRRRAQAAEARNHG